MSSRPKDDFVPDEDDFDQFGMDDDDDFSRGMSSHTKSGTKGYRGGGGQNDEEEDVELRPVKAGKTFLFGAVDNI